MVRTRNLRSVANENDENSTDTTRLTRAKAATLKVDELSMANKGLQSKKTTVAANPTRKRNALGDVTNATKGEAAEAKKPVKAALAPKATAGVQKRSTTTTTRSAAVPLKEKANNTKVASSKTGPGAIGPLKRKVPSATANAVVKEKERVSEESEPAPKKVHTLEAEKKTKVEESLRVKPSNIEEDLRRKEAAPPPVAAEPTEHVFPEGVEDLDREDYDDPLMVAEYANDIFEYLRDLECNSVPNPHYMDHQDDLEWKTRGILIDWLVEVHTRFHLLPETLFLAVNIIDRFLSEKVVQLDRLQLVGITAMFIASKYEEVLSPHIANFRHVADDGFSEAEILSAERFVLQTLNYDLSYPNPMNFLRRISKADNYDIHSRTLGKYLMEISLLDHRFMAYRPSHIAAAAMYCARMCLNRGEWDETLAYYAGYTEAEIEPVYRLMVDYLARPVCHEAFFKKYASKKFLKASIVTRAWGKKQAGLLGIQNLGLTVDQISDDA